MREWSRGGLEKVGNTIEPAWDSENENGSIRIMGRENSLVFGVTDHFYECDAFTVSLTALHDILAVGRIQVAEIDDGSTVKWGKSGGLGWVQE